MNVSPEAIQAVFAGLVALVGAVTAWQQKKVNELTARVVELETQMEEERGKFKAAVRVIRGLQRYIDDLCAAMRRAGQDPPANPVTIPPELEDEI
ncbi:hypothetical protein [Nocardia sp. CY41]|uniref:hypothetical protein n=1 Tax=Nocardia sp. CY41 TaxID=2608686 RepID=UPI00135779F5|nr:hypothetical protein [Nocardia sp. CY41]